MTFGEKVLRFYRSLHFNGALPAGIGMMNPYHNDYVKNITALFYTRFYNDFTKRIAILGINPGRFGAGATGIPFTDTVRLNQHCGIVFDAFKTYEPSSVFLYDMIVAFGGVEAFYSRYFISAVCPFGFTKKNEKGHDVNYNYYDSRELTEAVYDFIVHSISTQISMGIDTEKCYCLGTGKNDAFFRKLNDRFGFFKSIITLEHPRYIMQYKARMKETYIRKYIEQLQVTSEK